MNEEKEKRIEEIRERINAIDNKRIELEIVKEGLLELKQKEGMDIILPFGAGIFLKGKLEKVDEVLISVGANVMVERKVDEAVRMIDENLSELEKARKEMLELLEKLSEE